jgi:hypothetical protein
MRLARPFLRSKNAVKADVPDARDAVLAQNDATGSRCSLVERNGIESWRRRLGAPPSDLDEVRKNTSNLLGLLDNGDDFHFGSALGADKRIDRYACAS